MRELFWAIAGLLVLLTLTLIALGLRFQSENKTGLVASNIFEDGLLFGMFAILFAPVYLAWMGAQSLWIRFHPPAALCADENDAVWGRKVNRQVIETAFLAVQQARINYNANLAKRFISQDLYKTLRRECNRRNDDIGAERRKNVFVKDVVFTDERIDRAHYLCHLNATVSGNISTSAIEDDATGNASESSEAFEAQLEFARALPEVPDAHWQLVKISGLE